MDKGKGPLIAKMNTPAKRHNKPKILEKKRRAELYWKNIKQVFSKFTQMIKALDIEEDNYNIDVNKLEAAITKNTRAIIPVHLYGQPVKDLDRLINIAKQHSIYVIEDCAQAVFCKYKNQHVGTFGDIATISFYPGKNLGAFGDAGAVIVLPKPC